MAGGGGTIPNAPRRRGGPAKLVRLALGPLAALALAAALPAVGPGRPALAGEERPVAVRLRELNGSGVSGRATLTAAGARTVVAIRLRGTTGTLPATLHRGTCRRLDPEPAYPLTDAAPGRRSTTTVEAPLAELVGGRYAIAIHESVRDLAGLLDPERHVACGDLAPPVTAVPDSGTGFGATPRRDGGDGIVGLGLGALAATLAAGGLLGRLPAARVVVVTGAPARPSLGSGEAG
jgi:hypothetical protein